MENYTYTDASQFGVIIRSDGASIPTDPANSDYQRYLAYVANGNKEPDSTLPSNSSTPQAGA